MKLQTVGNLGGCILSEVNMTKKLEKGSAWDKADTNGDNIITDAELDAQLAREERKLRMENNDKKEDQQRYMVWFSMVTVTGLIVAVLIPGLIPVERLDHIGPILSTFLISNMGVIGSFIAMSAWSKTKETK
tara:strand:- start:2340 stop:2735 length:396 start_codon:yes stop_codon:yes gene_type:complete